MPPIDWKKALVRLTPAVILMYLGNRLAWLYRHCVGQNALTRIYVLLRNIQLAFCSVLPSLYPSDLLFGLGCGIALMLLMAYRASNAKKLRTGSEYGSAKWGTPKDIAPFIDPVFDNNIILTATERLTMNSRPKDPKYARNKNVLVIGGSGSGKSRSYVTPNLLQASSSFKTSFLVTDPKGELILNCGAALQKNGHTIRVFNTIDFNRGQKYNPLRYIHSEKDILKLVNVLILNTKGEGEKATEDFWVKSERLLYSALIGYLYYEAPPEEQNFSMLLDMLNAFEVREEDENFKNAIDLLFDELAEKNPNHFAVRQYRKFKLAAGKTAKSILISCAARLAPFDIQELRDLTEYDELALDTIGDTPTALFIIVSDTDTTFNFLVAMMYSQLFNLLCEHADKDCGGRLPCHVRFLLDEFANIGQIPMFDKLIATIRSREISASIILQSQSQLKTIYKDAAETIIGNCDTVLFLGGKEPSTLREISETLGKETIDLYNTSDTRGQSRSFGTNYQKTGHELMSRDELAVMDGNKCILQLRGVRPFYSDKFDIKKHKRYHMLAEANPKNAFDVETYLKHQFNLQPDEVMEAFSIDSSQLVDPDEADSER